MSFLGRNVVRVVSVLTQLALLTALYAQSQVKNSEQLGNLSPPHSSKQGLTFTTKAYQSAVLELLINEANRVARELKLKEDMPISETNLVESYITPPRMAQGMKAVGNISTRNYRYYFSVNNKFSFLALTDLERDYDRLQKDFSEPRTLIDTNAAYRLATQYLAAVSMDVAALNRDCRTEILAWTPGGTNFVPVYWVRWYKVRDVVAMVELYEPTQSLRQLRVESPEYILRDPIDTGKLGGLIRTNSSQSNTLQ